VTTLRRLAALFTTLMLLSTAAFVIGVTIEKNQGHSESGIEQAHSGETGEASETHEQTEGETTGTETPMTREARDRFEAARETFGGDQGEMLVCKLS